MGTTIFEWEVVGDAMVFQHRYLPDPVIELDGDQWTQLDEAVLRINRKLGNYIKLKKWKFVIILLLTK